MKKYFEIWKAALLKPANTFKTQSRKANLKEGAMHVGLAGLIVGVIVGLAMLLLGTTIETAGFGAALGITGFIASVILTPIISIIGWLIGSGIYYIVAMILGGKGSYSTQSYLIAIYSAPISIITSIVGLIPIIGLLNFVIFLYSLYLLTLALKETHRFTTIKAALVWIIPIVLIALAAIFLGTAFIAGLGLGSFADLGSLGI